MMEEDLQKIWAVIGRILAHRTFIKLGTDHHLIEPTGYGHKDEEEQSIKRAISVRNEDTKNDIKSNRINLDNGYDFDHVAGSDRKGPKLQNENLIFGMGNEYCNAYPMKVNNKKNQGNRTLSINVSDNSPQNIINYEEKQFLSSNPSVSSVWYGFRALSPIQEDRETTMRYDGVETVDDNSTVVHSPLPRLNFATLDSNAQDGDQIHDDFCARITDSLASACDISCSFKESENDLERDSLEDLTECHTLMIGDNPESIKTSKIAAMNPQSPNDSKDTMQHSTTNHITESKDEPEGARLPDENHSPNVNHASNIDEKISKKTVKKIYSRRIVSKRKRLISATLDLFGDDIIDE